MAKVKRMTGTELDVLLRRHGLQTEAQKYRIDRKAEYELAGGKSALVAKKRSWEDMHDKYRPLAEALEASGGRVVGAPAADFTPEQVRAAVEAKVVGGQVSEPSSGNGESVEGMGESVVRRARVTPDQIERRGTLEEIVRWVATNIHSDLPDPETCPDPEAWMLWEAYKGNPSRFVENVWSKVRLGKDAIGAQERMSDDGRAVLKLIDRVERARDAAEGNVRPVSAAG